MRKYPLPLGIFYAAYVTINLIQFLAKKSRRPRQILGILRVEIG